MRLAAALLGLLSLACTAPGGARGPVPSDAPYVLVLGTAQDGGLPQIGCTRDCCQRARRDERARRLVTSLLVVDPRSGSRWLLDASPDLPEQVELARGHADRGEEGGARPRLFEGIFLTHAHMGHYAGLLHLGREAYGGVPPLWASTRMAEFLRSNAPWDALTGDVRTLTPGAPVELAADLTLEPLAVPHRDEYSDTLAFLLRGPSHSLLYLPDIDKWERWERPIEDLLRTVDVALLDATFFSPNELPGRDLSEIPHPFVTESLARFAPLPEPLRARIHFTHLNHSNPAADPQSPPAATIRRAGMHVARRGDLFPL